MVFVFFLGVTLPKTNIFAYENDGCQYESPNFWGSIFRENVSFREGKDNKKWFPGDLHLFFLGGKERVEFFLMCWHHFLFWTSFSG